MQPFVQHDTTFLEKYLSVFSPSPSRDDKRLVLQKIVNLVNEHKLKTVKKHSQRRRLQEHS